MIAVSHSKADLANLSGINSVIGEVADLTQPEEVEGLWKRIDERGLNLRALVNLAGGWRGGDWFQQVPTTFDLSLISI